ASEVHTDHPAARAFVDLVLGSYVKCNSLEAMRDHPAAVTRECFLRRNFTTRHLNPRVYRRWFIGERALSRQIEQRQARLNEISDEIAALQPLSTALRERLALTRDKARPLLELERALPVLTRIPELDHQLRSLRYELGRLDRGSVESLRAEVARCQAEFDRLQAEARQLDQQVGGWEAKAKALEGETIPQLELAAGESMQSARGFLATESVEAMLEEVEKEYERRRERQPLETVLANAARYEGDYQSAEARSRDRLREAKQAYSLKYDFGYDNDEDAARYMQERDKFVQSELPQYEARIAEQRALAEQELVENFIHRLREQIEEARQQLDYLNATLRELRFGGERFEFITRPAPPLKQVYDMVMDSQTILGDSLFESDFRQKHQPGWDLLFERLTAKGDETLTELRELQDYRNYLEYDIRIHYPNGDRALLSQINAKKSGGETTTPFYVAMAASFAQAYRLNQPRPSDTIRLALFDEAFSKMDTARTASALQFMRDTGLQVLLATPPDKSGALLAHVDSVRTVVRKNSHSFVIEIDKAEMMKELEGGNGRG
ncbi:MAG: SbcC/MukB-like Walker B domain-containing protein, partial [Anaerolineales bacterium]